MQGELGFFDVFSDLELDEKIKNIFDGCIINEIELNKNKKEININIILKKLLNFENKSLIIEKLKNEYDLNNVNLFVAYNNIQINEHYFNNLKEQLFYCLPICKSYLQDSIFNFESNALTIKTNLDSEILQKNNCDKLIKEIFLNELAINIDVFFENEKQIDNYFEKKDENEKQLILEATKNINIEGNKKVNSENKKNTAIFGKEIKDKPSEINEITSESGRACICGTVTFIETREIRGGKFIFAFDVTDFNNSLTIKKLAEKAEFEKLKNEIGVGMSLLIRGDVYYDKYSREINLSPIDIVKIEKEEKKDLSEQKRVELHLHTQMSAMDCVANVTETIKRAAKWGHKALAITDHGVVQAFPDAYEAGKKNNVKIIYGVECYLVNDSIPIVFNANDNNLFDNIVVFDIETTGLSAQYDKIIEIGAVKIENGAITDKFNAFVNPEIPIPENITELTGITNEMVAGSKTADIVVSDFLSFCKNSVVIAHNARFDCGFILANAKRYNLLFENPILDTLELSRALLPSLSKHRLDSVAKHFKIKQESHHRADDDARVAAEIYLNFANMLKEKGVEKISEINNTLSGAKDIKKMPSYHCIILAKNYAGLLNLYKIISKSHLDFFYKTPRVPKSLIVEHREGLIIGSACEAGELFSAIQEGKPKEEIEKIIRFYDYLEIQPLMNNKFLIENGSLKNIEQLKSINKKIVELGEESKKPVVATCDVHFLDPKDEVFRRILMTGQGFKDADNQAPLYFRTTEEMLLEFDYLGEEKAFEVVVTNTNKIADMTDEIMPIPDGTFPPEIEGSDEELIERTTKRAKEIYGDNLPEIVKERMDRELNSIIKHGFAVMYIIAQKLVSKSLSDGYLVGSRGSVGSSFVAFLAGITEVNALMPHYVCKSCKYSEFIDDGSAFSGCDMEDKNCPNCGEKLNKDGHDIPFETFLGFDGDKEPDIDLNFSGEYQSEAHRFTEEIFGEGNVFRAGTIGTIAEKTAYGFVKKYFEAKGKVLHNAEINRLVRGCTGVKKTTGQHPGGVMIVPKKNEIFEFCPIQRPADDTNSNIITTHFDYHSISGRLLKLDILGHDDPTVIKMLQDLTGVDPLSIPLDDEETMSLFTSTNALKVSEKDINSTVGTFAIPEFGTKFVRQMLIDTKPKTFAELVRISGLSHGTDVWLNNAKDLVIANIATLKDVICTRDDIMVYLMHKGLPKKQSFKIMESVRKGKGISEDDEKLMRQCDVPQWYIESCKKIKYMFPKAHAVAYVTMAFRIAYFKVHHPLAFYLAFFSVRADEFDAELMAKGKEKALSKIKELESKGNDITAKEKNVLTILEVCLEMYCRGFSFAPIDLYKSDATKFLNENNKILPPFKALGGLGETAAKSIVEERKIGKFFSKEDLVARCKISKPVMELLEKNGCLKDLPESSQLTLF